MSRYEAKFDTERTFGIEMEVADIVDEYAFVRECQRAGLRIQSEGYNHHVRTHWKLISDSSLSGPNTMEIVSPPLKGYEGLREIEKLCEVCRRLGVRVNTTCGLHVHHYAGDCTGEDLKNLYRLYAKFEPVIDYFVSRSRRASRSEYCRSMMKDSDLSWVNRLTPRSTSTARDVANGFENSQIGGRYHKVNTKCFLTYGTVEFRQHQGTTDFEKISTWIVFTQLLLWKAKHEVSPTMTVKITLGELWRCLRVIDSQYPPQVIILMREFLTKRYEHFKRVEREARTASHPIPAPYDSEIVYGEV